MKNIFASKSILAPLAFQIVTEIQPTIQSWVNTGEWSGEMTRVIVQNVVLTGILAIIRYNTDEAVYTPKFLPGRDKEEERDRVHDYADEATELPSRYDKYL